jgi:hypothetical protein
MAVNSLGIQTYFPLTQPQFDECVNIVETALQYWNVMMVTFAAENVAMGITQAGKTQLISDALEQVALYGSQGSLWLAYNALSQIQITPEMAPFLTAERVEWMQNQMITIIAMLP